MDEPASLRVWLRVVGSEAVMALLLSEEDGSDGLVRYSSGEVELRLVPVEVDEDWGKCVFVATTVLEAPLATWPYFLDENQRAVRRSPFPDGESIFLSRTTTNSMDEALGNFFADGFAALEGTVRRAVQLARWRVNALRFDPYNGSHDWSLDGETWHRMFVYRMSELKEGSEFLDPYEFEDSLGRGESAPLARELLNEAFAVLGTSGGRSALVLGVASAEVGLKQFAAAASSSSSEGWLLMSMPSPPLSRLMRRYLPHLTSRRTTAGDVLPQVLLRALESAVERRNEIVHTGASAASIDEVEQTLNSVSDFLYLLDWFAGHDFAFDLLSEATRNAWE